MFTYKVFFLRALDIVKLELKRDRMRKDLVKM